MAIFSGLANIGRDVEVRYTQSGKAVANLALAFNYGNKGDDGNRPTQWVEASMWEARAEALAPYLLRGTKVFVVISDLHIETYEGKNGQGSKLVGRLIDIEFASKPQSGDGEGQQRGQQQGQQRSQQRPQQKPRNQAKSNTSFDDMDDDIPF